MRQFFGVMVVAVLAGGLLSHASGQALARKNWQGSGITPDAWWANGVFCRIDLRASKDLARGGLRGVTTRLDTLSAIGCDALELGLVGLNDPAGAPFAGRYGTLDDADALIEAVGRHKLRLVIDLPLGPHEGALEPAAEQVLTGKMRFWLSRGAAGFVLEGSGDAATPALAAMVHRLHQITANALGTRVLLGDGLELSAADDVPLSIRRVRYGGAAEMRAALAAVKAGAKGPATVLEGVETGPEAMRVELAMLLARGGPVVIPVDGISGTSASGSGDEDSTAQFSPDELLLWMPKGAAWEAADRLGLVAWAKALGELHHGNPVLRGGAVTYLDDDARGLLVWVVQAGVKAVPTVVVCNVSGKPQKVSIAADIKAAGVKKTYLRTLLRTAGPGAKFATLDEIDMEADGVFVGEMR